MDLEGVLFDPFQAGSDSTIQDIFRRAEGVAMRHPSSSTMPPAFSSTPYSPYSHQTSSVHQEKGIEPVIGIT